MTEMTRDKGFWEAIEAEAGPRLPRHPAAYGVFGAMIAFAVIELFKTAAGFGEGQFWQAEMLVMSVTFAVPYACMQQKEWQRQKRYREAFERLNELRR